MPVLGNGGRCGRCALLSLLLLLTACAVPLPQDGGDQAQDLLRQRGLSIPGVAGQFTGPLTRVQAVQAALLHHPDIRAQYARLDIAAADVVRASELLNPVVSIASLDAGAAGTELNLGISQSLASLMLRPVRQRIAEADHALAVLSLTDALQILALDTEAAWYGLVAAEQRLRVQTWAALTADLAWQLAQRFADAGNITPLQQAQHARVAAEAALDRIAAERIRDRARNDLATRLALPHDRWSVPAALPLPAPAVDSAAYVARAMAQHPELQRLGLRQARLAQRLDEAGAERWINGANIGLERERRADERGAGPAVSVRAPLWNRPRGEVLALAAEQRVLAEEEASLRLQLPIQLRRQLTELDQMRAAINLRETQLLPALAAEVEARQQLVNFMLDGVFNLLSTKLDQLQGWRAQIDGLDQYWQHEVALARIAGFAIAGVGERVLDLAPIAPIAAQGSQTHHHPQGEPNE
jgi:outer membrane protein, heavy metal efflux system